MRRFISVFAGVVVLLATLAAGSAHAQKPLEFGVGLFQPDKEKNDATYKPLADYLSKTRP